jgi:hypothetical protein
MQPHRGVLRNDEKIIISKRLFQLIILERYFQYKYTIYLPNRLMVFKKSMFLLPTHRR